MSEEKKTAVTEEVKEARKLTEEELEKVNGGMITGAAQMEGAVLVVASIDGCKAMKASLNVE